MSENAMRDPGQDWQDELDDELDEEVRVIDTATAHLLDVMEQRDEARRDASRTRRLAADLASAMARFVSDEHKSAGGDK